MRRPPVLLDHHTPSSGLQQSRPGPGKALPWVGGKTGLALAPGQADAVRAALSSKISVITGGPDIRKTTIVNSILRILSAKGVDILLCAPTGRAAKRMNEATGLEAKTIHRLLEIDPRERRVQARRAQPAPLRPAGDRRDVDGGRDTDAGAAGGGPRRSRPPDRGRCRPAALGGAQHYAMLKRNLLYTGVTRGKRLVVLVDQKKAVAIAVHNASGRRRWSKLDEWLAHPTGGAESGIPAGAGAQQGSTLTGAMPYG